MKLKVLYVLLTATLYINEGIAQNRPIETSAGIYFTGDAAMEFIGPSFLIAQDIPVFIDKFSIVPYAQYFYAIYNTPEDNFTSYAVGIMLQMNHYSVNGNGFYYALGLAFQYKREYYYGDEEKEDLILPAFRIGYRFLAKKYKLHAEITTPAFDAKGAGFELFTLPSIGLRIGF